MNLDSNEKVNQSAAKKQPKHHAKKHKHMNLKASLVDSNLLSEKAGPLLWEDIHEAKVQKIEDDRVFVEILNPAKPEPLIALASKLEFDLPICEGSKVCVYLEKPFGLSQADNMPKASIKKAQELSELKALSGLVEARESVKGFIASPVKGGYSVTLMVNSREEAENGLGLRAFLPLSQATLGREVPVFSDNVPFMFKVKEFEPKTGNIIVSLKDILLKKKREKEKQFWENAKEGSLVTGVVRSLVSYGAFVDVGGVDGLLHVSDMSWANIRSPNSTV